MSARIPAADIVAAHKAARQRRKITREQGVVYAECLRAGRVPSPKSIATSCGLKPDRAVKALDALKRADLIPGRPA